MTDLGEKTAAVIQGNIALKEAPLKPSSEMTALWSNVHAAMREEFGEAIFRSWLKPLTLQAYYHGTMEISVPTRFMRDWIQTHYAARIEDMCREANADIKKLQLVVIQNSSLLNDSNDDAKDDNVLSDLSQKKPTKTVKTPLQKFLLRWMSVLNLNLLSLANLMLLPTLQPAALLKATLYPLTRYSSMAVLVWVKRTLCTRLRTH